MDYTRYNTEYILSDNLSLEDMAKTVTDIIMEEYEGVLIERCVKTRYDFLAPEEQIEVIKNAKELAKDCKDCSFPPYEKRREEIYAKIKEYLKEHGKIVPCGFVDFRMREEYYHAQEMTAKGADLYFDRKEYEEFTYLLSVFVAEKESREEVIHLLWTQGDIKLYNKRRRDVTKKYEKEFIMAAREKNISGEDLAISALIAAAPEKIVLHNAPSGALKETVIKIFGDRCVLCKGCNFCKNS